MKRILWLLTCVVMLAGCNSDKKFTIVKPSITLDNDQGVYTVKLGNELIIAPDFTDLGNGSVTWIMDGSTIAEGLVFKQVWTQLGTFYITIKATNEAGSAIEEIRVEVIEPAPPVIDMGADTGTVYVAVNTDHTFAPEISGAETVEWRLDGVKVGSEPVYCFHATGTGTYTLELKAANQDGSTTESVRVEVVETLPYRVYFTSPSLRQTSTTRYTFANRSVCLYPMTENLENAEYKWTVNGKAFNCTDRMCVFTPDKAGEYNITVTVTDNDKHAEANIKVVCVSETESQRMRRASASSKQTQSAVLEYVPAPGQFINEGMTAINQDAANAWATEQLADNYVVSLGACGGYIIVGFDHSIPAGGADYDFVIGSNAISTSNEPGIVWVMQDVNGNGLPDDEWYELRGSETGKSTTMQHHAVTYYRPSGSRQTITWTNNYGQSGRIPVNSFHTQDSYYPAWIDSDTYTLYGTQIGARNIEDPTTGFWDNKPYDWGYVDNLGTDNLTSGSWPGTGQRNGFKISNAMYGNGKAVTLQYIDFIKVMTGVNTVSGMIGEVSTEVSGFYDCSIK